MLIQSWSCRSAAKNNDERRRDPLHLAISMAVPNSDKLLNNRPEPRWKRVEKDIVGMCNANGKSARGCAHWCSNVRAFKGSCPVSTEPIHNAGPCCIWYSVRTVFVHRFDAVYIVLCVVRNRSF